MNIIAKLSFWIRKPKETEKSATAFEQLIMDALAQFGRENYVKKLTTSTTSKTLPSNKEDLLEFLFNQITNT